jgi:predicted nucleic acid-binding protein
LQRLDDFRQALEFVPIAQEALFRAADLWAAVRQQGKQTASDKALDGDVILAAQVLTLDPLPADVVVATTNPGHLARFIAAEEWSKIVP